MSIYIKDTATDKMVRELAELRGVTLTEAIRAAIEQALAEQRRNSGGQRLAKLKEIQDRIALWPKSGLKADKAFYDSLNDEDD